jgi:transcriptional regulator with XRE-family HTH domain
VPTRRNSGIGRVAGMVAVARLDGAALARAREAAGLSQSALAQRVGASSKQRIWHWERGAEQPQPRFVPEIARVTDIEKRTHLPPSARQPLAKRRIASLNASTISGRPCQPEGSHIRAGHEARPQRRQVGGPGLPPRPQLETRT